MTDPTRTNNDVAETTDFQTEESAVHDMTDIERKYIAVRNMIKRT